MKKAIVNADELFAYLSGTILERHADGSYIAPNEAECQQAMAELKNGRSVLCHDGRGHLTGWVIVPDVGAKTLRLEPTP